MKMRHVYAISEVDGEPEFPFVISHITENAETLEAVSHRLVSAHATYEEAKFVRETMFRIWSPGVAEGKTISLQDLSVRAIE